MTHRLAVLDGGPAEHHRAGLPVGGTEPAAGGARSRCRQLFGLLLQEGFDARSGGKEAAMTGPILIEEVRVTFLVPRGPGKSESKKVTPVLGGGRFRRDLGRAVRAVLRRYPALRKVRVRFTH